MSKEPQFTRKQALALPSYSIKKVKVGQSLFLKMESEIHLKMAKNDDGTEHELPLILVTDLITGETGEMVLPFVVNKALSVASPLTGRSFELIKGEKKGRTDEWSVYEINA
jgi:hypothetical protein